MVSVRRCGVLLLLWSSLFLSYLDRSLVVAAAPLLQQEFGLSEFTMGIIFSAFFWSYSTLQIPGGMLSDRFGVKRVLGWGVCLWSLSTIATAWATGWRSLAALRFLLGVTQVPGFPAGANALAKWFPAHERGLACGIWDSGAKIGAAVAMPLTAYLIARFGWRSPFLIIGPIGLIWLIFWFRYFRNTPDKDANSRPFTPSPRACRLLPNTTVILLCLSCFCIFYAQFFYYTWLPTYLVQARRMSMTEMGATVSLCIACAAIVQILGGWLSDRLITRYSVRCVRISIVSIGALLAAATMFAIDFAPTAWLTAVLSVSNAACGLILSQLWPITMDAAPTEVMSTMVGWINMASTLGGGTMSIVTGALISATDSYQLALAGCAAMCLLALLAIIMALYWRPAIDVKALA